MSTMALSARLDASTDDAEGSAMEDLTEIRDCYCPNCGGGNTTTTILPTKIPMFRQVIIMSLTCPDCGFRNSETNFGGEIQPMGERIDFVLTCRQDLNRQIVKSDSATVSIPSLEFEIPPTAQRGTITTLEGMLKRATDHLQEQQPERLRLGDIDNFHRCQHVMDGLRRILGDESTDTDDKRDDEEQFPIHIILDDPAGNSFLENPSAPKPDPNVKSTRYFRTQTQDLALGLQPPVVALEAGNFHDSNPSHKNPVNGVNESHSVEIDDSDVNLLRQEVVQFSTTCPHCRQEAETNMCMVNIPHFKEVIIMSLLCEKCGYKSREIKGGGAIPKCGMRITLRVQSTNDLSREVLKSDTAGIEIPELGLELKEGGIGGMYTTVEGLLNKLHDRLETANPFGSGDAAKKQHRENDGGEFSAPSPNHVQYIAFLEKLKGCVDGNACPFTLVISDPLSNSFVGPVPQDAIALSFQAGRDSNTSCYDVYIDPGMDIEEYERTHEQNEMLGLNDILTENYRVSENDGDKT